MLQFSLFFILYSIPSRTLNKVELEDKITIDYNILNVMQTWAKLSLCEKLHKNPDLPVILA